MRTHLRRPSLTALRQLTHLPFRSLGQCCLIVLLCAGSGSLAHPNDAILVHEWVYELNSQPFAESHASTVVELQSLGVEGRADSVPRLAAAWFGGTEEQHRDVEIYFAVRDEKEWSQPRAVANGIVGSAERYPCWNPVLFQQPNGPLHLFYKVGRSPKDWWGMQTTSSDGGHTWSEAKKLPDEILGPIKNKGLLLPDGRLLCGSSTETGVWTSHFEIFDPANNNWQRLPDFAVVDDLATIQPTLLDHGGGVIQSLMRVRKKGPIAESWSRDGGHTWSRLQATTLIHPGSGIDGVRLPDGRLALVYNDHPTERTPLVVALSRDGRTWKTAVTLEDIPGEYSYPACIVDSQGMLQITYTYDRKSIRYAKIDPAKLDDN